MSASRRTRCASLRAAPARAQPAAPAECRRRREAARARAEGPAEPRRLAARGRVAAAAQSASAEVRPTFLQTQAAAAPQGARRARPFAAAPACMSTAIRCTAAAATPSVRRRQEAWAPARQGAAATNATRRSPRATEPAATSPTIPRTAVDAVFAAWRPATLLRPVSTGRAKRFARRDSRAAARSVWTWPATRKIAGNAAIHARLGRSAPTGPVPARARAERSTAAEPARIPRAHRCIAARAGWLARFRSTATQSAKLRCAKRPARPATCSAARLASTPAPIPPIAAAAR